MVLPVQRTVLLAIVAVPTIVSPAELLLFFDDAPSRIRILRHPGSADRAFYPCIALLPTQEAADEFYLAFHGKHFRSGAPCYCVFLSEIRYMEGGAVSPVA